MNLFAQQLAVASCFQSGKQDSNEPMKCLDEDETVRRWGGHWPSTIQSSNSKATITTSAPVVDY